MHVQFSSPVSSYLPSISRLRSGLNQIVRLVKERISPKVSEEACDLKTLLATIGNGMYTPIGMSYITSALQASVCIPQVKKRLNEENRLTSKEDSLVLIRLVHEYVISTRRFDPRPALEFVLNKLSIASYTITHDVRHPLSSQDLVSKYLIPEAAEVVVIDLRSRIAPNEKNTVKITPVHSINGEYDLRAVVAYDGNATFHSMFLTFVPEGRMWKEYADGAVSLASDAKVKELVENHSHLLIYSKKMKILNLMTKIMAIFTMCPRCP